MENLKRKKKDDLYGRDDGIYVGKKRKDDRSFFYDLDTVIIISDEPYDCYE